MIKWCVISRGLKIVWINFICIMAAYLHLFASWQLICTICILHGFLHFTWFYALSFHFEFFFPPILLFIYIIFPSKAHFFRLISFIAHRYCTLGLHGVLAVPYLQHAHGFEPNIFYKSMNLVALNFEVMCLKPTTVAASMPKWTAKASLRSIWSLFGTRTMWGFNIEGEKTTQQLLTLTSRNTGAPALTTSSVLI